MESLRYRLEPALQNAGDFIALDGVLDEHVLTLGHTSYVLPRGIAYHVELSHAGEGIVVAGTATATVTGECARCLEEARFEADGQIEGYFVLEGFETPEELAEDEFEQVEPEGEIELADLIRAAIIYELPTVLLCRDDCLGLCPRCGANLNKETCGCKDAPDDDNPFSALKGLDFSK